MKSAKKAERRRLTAAKVNVQANWIATVLGVEATDRRERDRLFGQARQILEEQRRAA